MSGDLNFKFPRTCRYGWFRYFCGPIKMKMIFYSVVSNLSLTNSSDDFGIIVERSSERGYLTSNRKGGKEVMILSI